LRNRVLYFLCGEWCSLFLAKTEANVPLFSWSYSVNTAKLKLNTNNCNFEIKRWMWRDGKERRHRVTQQLEGWVGVNPEIEWLDRVKKEQGGEWYIAQWTTRACFYMTDTVHQVLRTHQPCKDVHLKSVSLRRFNLILLTGLMSSLLEQDLWIVSEHMCFICYLNTWWSPKLDVYSYCTCEVPSIVLFYDHLQSRQTFGHFLGQLWLFRVTGWEFLLEDNMNWFLMSRDDMLAVVHKQICKI